MLASCTNQSNSQSAFKDIADVESLTQNEDGTFRVVCKDGTIEERATRQRVLSNVCEPDPGPVDEPAYELKLRSMWAEDSATVGKQYLAIFSSDRYTAGEVVVIFGEDGGELKGRNFPTAYLFGTWEGARSSLQDNFYSLQSEAVTREHVKVTLQGRSQNYRYDLEYRKMAEITAELREQAEKVLRKMYQPFDELVEVETPADLKTLKNLLSLHMRSHSYSPNEDAALEWSFKDSWLQIEGYFDLSKPNRSMAGATIATDGSDAISRAILPEGKQWMDVNDIDFPTEEETGDDGWDDIEYYSFSTEVDGVLDGAIKKGLEAFSKYTVTIHRPFECEGGEDWSYSYKYVLTDGSIFYYGAGPECD